MARGAGGLLLAAAAGALRGDREREEAARLEQERERERRESDLFTRLRLAATPGVLLGEQPEAGTPLPEQPRGLPTSMRAVTKPRNLIELGSIALSGEDTPVSFDPAYDDRRKRTEAERVRGERDAANRSAFAFLHGRDPDAYPDFVEGFEYGDEVTSFLDDERTNRRDELRAKADEDKDDRERAEELAIRQAETRAFNLLEDGMHAAQVWADPVVREHLTRDDVIRLSRDVRRARSGTTDEQAVETRLAALQEAGVTGARAQAIANDPALYRQWERTQGEGDGVLDLLGEPEAEPERPKAAGIGSAIRGGFRRIFGRDQKDEDAQIRAFIEQNPDATDEEIAAMLQGL